ncbi:MAG: biotin--[acetyl-CoA-carboxylase] ligase [Acidobacteria bacterium]|nr:biotin--[acetyl-CoA-carboxylase] ligase [Acidobacteriota bacterium]
MSGEEKDSRIDKAVLRKALGDRLMGSRFLYFLTLTSTNEHARELAEDGWPEGTVVLSEEQTAGKGRAGRSWHSAPGLGLHVSVILKPALPPEKIPLMTLMAAVATARALRDGGWDASIKWPNDIMLGGRKIGGILADARLRPGAPADVVLGLGLNVNHLEADFPAELLPRAGSIRMQTGVVSDRTAILTAVLLKLEEAYRALKEGGAAGDAKLIEAFSALSPMSRGRSVTVAGEGEPFSGETAGVAASGALRVVTSSGVREIHVGDVSVGESDDAPRR